MWAAGRSRLVPGKDGKSRDGVCPHRGHLQPRVAGSRVLSLEALGQQGGKAIRVAGGSWVGPELCGRLQGGARMRSFLGS